MADPEYFLAEEMASSLRRAGGIVLGPVPSEDDALKILLANIVGLVIFNAELRDQRADILAEYLTRKGIPSLMVNSRLLPFSDPLCRGRMQLLYPVDDKRLQEVVASLLTT